MLSRGLARRLPPELSASLQPFDDSARLADLDLERPGEAGDRQAGKALHDFERLSSARAEADRVQAISSTVRADLGRVREIVPREAAVIGPSPVVAGRLRLRGRGDRPAPCEGSAVVVSCRPDRSGERLDSGARTSLGRAYRAGRFRCRFAPPALPGGDTDGEHRGVPVPVLLGLPPRLGSSPTARSSGRRPARSSG